MNKQRISLLQPSFKDRKQSFYSMLLSTDVIYIHDERIENKKGRSGTFSPDSALKLDFIPTDLEILVDTKTKTTKQYKYKYSGNIRSFSPHNI